MVCDNFMYMCTQVHIFDSPDQKKVLVGLAMELSDEYMHVIGPALVHSSALKRLSELFI